MKTMTQNMLDVYALSPLQQEARPPSGWPSHTLLCPSCGRGLHSLSRACIQVDPVDHDISARTDRSRRGVQLDQKRRARWCEAKLEMRERMKEEEKRGGKRKGRRGNIVHGDLRALRDEKKRIDRHRLAFFHTMAYSFLGFLSAGSSSAGSPKNGSANGSLLSLGVSTSRLSFKLPYTPP
jgi:hypothetical protein